MNTSFAAKKIGMPSWFGLLILNTILDVEACSEHDLRGWEPGITLEYAFI